jgi:hypothetical protein
MRMRARNERIRSERYKKGRLKQAKIQVVANHVDRFDGHDGFG